MIYLGSDHRGFILKEHLKKYLDANSHSYLDLGALILDESDDYTIYAQKVAKEIQKNPDDFGILLCGSGVGVDIVANKFDRVRASIGKSPDQVAAGRKDDNMNVLVIAADFTTEKEAEDLVKSFLETKFDKLPRHAKRLEDIAKIEENN